MSEDVLRLWSKEVREKTAPNDMRAKYAWLSAMQEFPLAVRYHAANLAAHNWDLTLIGDRLLISYHCSGGHWISKTGERSNITDEEWDAFYPRINGKAAHRLSDLHLPAPNTKDQDHG